MTTRNTDKVQPIRPEYRARVIPISGPHKQVVPEAIPEGQYKVLVVSDLHMNRPFRSDESEKREQKYTYFGNEMADGFFKSLKKVDELVLAGDMFDIDVMEKQRQRADKKSEEPLAFEPGIWQKSKDEQDEYWLRNRNNPEAFLEQIMHENPHLKVTYLVGNHDGMSVGKYDHNAAGSLSDTAEHSDAENANFNYLAMLERVRKRHENNFSYADHYQNGNLFLMHGHSHIDYIHNGEGDTPFSYRVHTTSANAIPETEIDSPSSASKKHASDAYVVVRGSNKKVAPDKEGAVQPKIDKVGTDMAKAIVSTDIMKQFIESQLGPETSGPNAEGTKEIYAGIGHRHRKLDVALDYSDFTPEELEKDPHEEMRNVILHLTDFGHTKNPNFKIYHFNEGQVDHTETINFKKISRNGTAEMPGIER